MKKYLLVSLTILFAAAFVSAAEATTKIPDIDIEAEATVTWGIDLGSGSGKPADIAKHGFKNEASWTVKFPLIKKGDMMSPRNESPVYAEVALKDIELNLQSKEDKKDFAFDGKVDKLEAKFVFYGAYLQVYNKPGFNTNYANLWDTLEKSDDYKKKKKDITYKFEPGFEGYGTKLGYANKNFMDLDVGLKFGSNGNWEAEDTDEKTTETVEYFDGEKKLGKNQTAKKLAELSNAKPKEYTIKDKDGKLDPGTYLVTTKTDKEIAPHSKYGIGLDFSMKPLDKMLGIKLNVNSTLALAKSSKNEKDGYRFGLAGGQTTDAFGFNVGTEVSSKPIDGLELKLGFDGGTFFDTKKVKGDKSAANRTFAWDLLFDTKYKWVSAGVYAASAGTPYSWFDGKNTNIPDMATYIQFKTEGEKKESSYLLEGLDAGVHLGLYRMISFANRDTSKRWDYPILMKLWGSYKAKLNDSMSLKPFATFWMETNHKEDAEGKETLNPYTGFAYDVGIAYSPAEKVELTAKWEHGKIRKNEYGALRGKDKNGLLIEAPINHRTHNGRFTLALKVEY